MATWLGLRSLVIVAVWAAIGLAMALMIVSTAEAGWWSYGVAGVTVVLYTCACVAFMREQRRKRPWA